MLRTAGSTKLSVTHSTAALNGLCGFLELCSLSPVSDIRAISFSFTSWTRAFRIFHTRSENYKAKPLKRLLLTLTQLVLRHPLGEKKSKLIQYAVFHATRAIRKQDEVNSVKAAIQTLEHFLNKRIIDALELAWASDPHSATQDEENYAVRRDDAAMIHDVVNSFTLNILEWVQYPDCAPAAGRLLATFFGLLNELKGHGFDNAALPLWIAPVKQSLGRQQILLEVYENHILPDLLRLSVADREAFLRTLPFDDIQDGNTGKYTVIDIQLCLLVARIASSSHINGVSEASQNLRQEPEEHQGSRPLQNESGALDRADQRINVDIIRLGTSLLDHSIPAIRIAALSLLITFPAPTSSFPDTILESLQRSLPYFHVEVDAKARNDFISLMKKLCARLKSVILSLVRQSQVKSSATPDMESNPHHLKPVLGKRQINENVGILEKHLALRWWYLRFLIYELRPTSSYQSHIIALRVLPLLIEGEASIRGSVSKLDVHSPIKIGATSEDSSLRPLLDLLIDPFDDVREAAQSLLELHYPPTDSSVLPDLSEKEDAVSLQIRHEILAALKNAEAKAAETGRADQADGVGRLYNILYGYSRPPILNTPWHGTACLILEHVIANLEKEVKLARADLTLAVSVAPLHSHLIALRYVLTCRLTSYTILFALILNSTFQTHLQPRQLFYLAQRLYQVGRRKLD